MKDFYFGVTRFSVYSPASKAWVISNSLTEKEYLEKLFSDERMQPRFDIFVNNALPIYQKMAAKHNYKHILLYSKQLPDKWKILLNKAAEKYPVLLLQEDKNGLGMKEKMLETLEKKALSDCTVIWFRIDDDDILSTNYLNQLSQYAKPELSGMAVSFGYGIAAIYSDGFFQDYRYVHRPLLSQGQAYIGNYFHDRKNLNLPSAGSHAKTDLKIPVILDSRNISFMWTHHISQDTVSSKDPVAARKQVEKALAGYNSVEDPKTLIEHFPTLERDIKISTKVFRTIIRHDEKVKLTKDFLKFKTSIGGGQYRVTVVLSSNSEVFYPKGALISFYFNDHDFSDFPGLTKSKIKDIDWFRYLTTSHGESSLNP